jgi:hypothetical protein
MIEQSKFLGMPIRTRRQRRTLVVCFYIYVLAFAAVPLYRSRWFPMVMVVQTLVLGGLLGGLQEGGPVKPFSRPVLPLDLSETVWESVVPNNRPPKVSWPPLDERERTGRDQAHYGAYRILRWGLGVAALLYWLLLNWTPTKTWLYANSPTLLWLLLVFVLSLPQAVVLWTELDMETP